MPPAQITVEAPNRRGEVLFKPLGLKTKPHGVPPVSLAEPDNKLCY